MSLIEKEELARKIADAISWYRVHSSMITEKQLNYDKEIEVLTTMMSCIAQMPTVEAKSVRHARLINASPYGECSCCGKLIDSRDRFRYCPQCGARLVGEGEEE